MARNASAMMLEPVANTLVLATNNAGKLAEFTDLLKPLNRNLHTAGQAKVALPLEKTAAEGGTLPGNATLKAETLAAATGLWALADDSGLFVAALPHCLGVDTATYGGPAKLIGALAALPPHTPRTAVFRCVLALARPGMPTLVVEGQEKGLIASAMRGQSGFGYDSVFIEEKHSQTNAERLDAGEPTHQVKLHRQRAVAALLAALSQGVA